MYSNGNTMNLKRKPLNLAAKDRIFVALDVDTLDEAKKIMDGLVGLITNVKFGLQLATATSWAEVVVAGRERGFKVFCDSKFKDIPNTVEHAAAALTRHKPEFFTIMSDNSTEALRGIRRGVDGAAEGGQKPKVIAVTVLTSIGPEECQQIYGGDVQTKTKLFGTNAVEAGLDAIVCSPEEIELFRSDEKFNDTVIITPGVRPSWAATNDQNRFSTPGDAIKRGADMLVIGRPITQPPAEVGSSKEAVQRIIKEIEEALV
jgi:orotidine-5'-phosphate decarboxylase